LFHFEDLRLLGRPAVDDGHDLFTTNGAGATTMQAAVHWAEV
jgi:hypothetical protein